MRRGAIWVASLRGDLFPERRDHTAASEASPASRNLPSSESLTQNSGQEPASAGGDAPGVHQLLFARGIANGLRLSPDGTRLLFVSVRGDHSFIGVYTFATRTLQWMDPGVGLDHDAIWSPDGTSIAFIREVPIVSPIADRWLRAGAPWSIHVADASTGQGREVWTADPGPGSLFHAVSAHDQLTWTPDGRIVFPWEKGGWTRLYALSADSPRTAKPGNTAPCTLLTPGDFEVNGVAALGDTLLFSANSSAPAQPADPDRRHVWVVELAHSDRVGALTAGNSIETEPVLLSDGEPAMMAGGTAQPLVPSLLNNHGQLEPFATELIPATFPAALFVAPQPVIFPAADGLPIHGQLFLPRNVKSGTRLPAVVFFHGGSRRQMLLGFHPMQYYAQAYEFNQYLANHGFVVLSVNYRSGTGYGLDFRQALNYGANGASEDNDVVGAAKYLATRPDVDPKRIGAWGGSYGGYLTALALARHSDLYAAGVDLHGVHDWSLELDLWKPTDEPGVDQSAIARRAFQSSPLASIDRWKSPVLLMQGDDDRNVLFAQTVRLAAELRARHVPVEVEVFPDEVHDFLLQRTWIQAYEHAYAFLKRNLQQP